MAWVVALEVSEVAEARLQAVGLVQLMIAGISARCCLPGITIEFVCKSSLVQVRSFNKCGG